MRVKKAVIPAAGFGLRMLPITSVVPKELLPVCGKPVIQHVVEEAVEAGIEEIILILSEGKEAVAEYFRPNKKLEKRLLHTGKHDELRALEKIWNLAKITVIIQDEQKGLGHAVLCAKEAVGNQPFAVLLGDSIVKTDDCVSFTKKLVSVFDNHKRSVVGIQSLDRCMISRYGVFEGSDFDNGILKAQRVLEKPTEAETYSDKVFCARYVFHPDVFDLLEQTQEGKGNEIQLTDAMHALIDESGLLGFSLEGERFDIGDPNGLLLANLSLADVGCN